MESFQFRSITTVCPPSWNTRFSCHALQPRCSMSASTVQREAKRCDRLSVATLGVLIAMLALKD